MEIDQRKLKILAAIVENYIRTGEPIGSKTLAQMLEFQVSPATIRNEMSALFDMGLLEQPHTSAGRVPSHLGYRVYINQLMHCKPLTEEERDEIDALFNVKDPDPDRLLEDAANALAHFTNCATISTTITPKHVTVRRIEIVPVDRRTVVMLVVASNGVIKNKVSRVDYNLNREIIEFFNKFANNRFGGRSMDEISTMYVSSVAVALGEYSRVFTPLLAGIYELCKAINDGQYFASGETNLLGYKEFDAVAHDLLTTIGDRDKITEILPFQKEGVQISIGKENPISELTDSSVVVATYKIGKDSCGAIGVVGPVRLNYQKLIPHLEYFAKTLGKLLSDTLENED
ncbi:heat-inducible transcription repressor HrcA [Hydrogenoanaerobacterium saccharovorans]|uniref:Heat-inducible transcription repressor HrcA n=1 Tax=Hydrogenoanaerobacterium saccharovorans TaxID=474960 RepID=A0A1H8CK16_9FIRM|nr:heat-inducible transcriptional repressor HrcA [Hydrogenoanaerobacterium saccharovorans]RPF43167.1 heat-inducible transcription repressor HrcA [Hydrogenoanaerobacterium saccharovorans]SEM95370.1 heat-inducible transcription repressor HrcA [Hydrogenoanaerobacterium saccharovorans]